MATFQYIATSNGSNKIVKGEIEALGRDDAIKSITKQQLTPISIKPVTKLSNEIKFSLLKPRNVKQDELSIFTRQLSTMINAGVPLTRSLNSLQEHTENPVFRDTLENIKGDVESGVSLADALGKHPKVFSDIYVNMVRAGEAAGILDEVLNRLAVQQEKSATIRKKIKSAMTYPVVLVVISVLAFFGLMIFVIPKIGQIIIDLGGPDAELPLITKIMLGISNFIISFWYILFPVIGACCVGIKKYLATPQGKTKFHIAILKLPAVSTIIKKVAVARFARTYASLIGAGVSVIEALSITSRAVGNKVYESALQEACTRLENGEQLSRVIEEKSDLFPSILAQMLAVGEETGQTDTVLAKVADFYEEEVDTAIESISSIIEPVMIVFMGGMVGLIAASVMLPIASLSQNVKE
ncbi:type II secretion system F family protein [Candidatus Saccharibacteria bacterium]|nr:type II secretion system F family protein [Candidatus Saccharibacteria bacterium]